MDQIKGIRLEQHISNLVFKEFKKNELRLSDDAQSQIHKILKKEISKSLKSEFDLSKNQLEEINQKIQILVLKTKEAIEAKKSSNQSEEASNKSASKTRVIRWSIIGTILEFLGWPFG